MPSFIEEKSEWYNKRILITGGTGTFGNAILDRLIKYNDFAHIRVVSRDEKKQYDMRAVYKDYKNIEFVLGDMRDYNRMLEVTKDIDYVFQAGALKHVDSCEFFPMEAVKTNIIGASNVLNASIENGVEKIVAITTDKGVAPFNVMGMTKALQERIFIKAKDIKACCIRYGNVMYSRGSAIPLFVKKAKDKEKIPITHNRMTRFLLSIYDAIDLVEFALKNMCGGEIFVKKSPSAYMTDIADIINERYNGIGTEEIGIKQGEKLNEVLISEEESIYTNDLGNYFKIDFKNKINDNVFKYSSFEELRTKEEIKQLFENNNYYEHIKIY